MKDPLQPRKLVEIPADPLKSLPKIYPRRNLKEAGDSGRGCDLFIPPPMLF